MRLFQIHITIQILLFKIISQILFW